MLTGSEATTITRACGAVLPEVRQQATTSPEWPSLHASLMDLHAIIDQYGRSTHATDSAREILSRFSHEDPCRQRFAGRWRAHRQLSESTDGTARATGRVKLAT